MSRLLHLLTVLTGSIAISGCLFFVLAPLFPLFTEGDSQLKTEIQTYLFNLHPPVLIGQSQLSNEEERHLLDVKRIFQNLFWITLCTGILPFIRLLLPQRGRVLRNIGQAGLAYLALSGAILLCSGFRTGFIELHRLLFLADTWWFISDSSLIQLFPLSFFQQFVLTYTILAAFIFGSCWWFNRNSPADQPAYTKSPPSDNQSGSESH